MIDPTATEPVTIRCVCPGTPHESDTVDVRSQWGYGDSLALAKRSIRYRTVTQEGKPPVIVPYTEAFAEHEALLEIAVRSWSLVDAGGAPLPVNLANVLLLPEDVGSVIAEKANATYAAGKSAVPNGSSAPSPHSSAESSGARPNRATRRSKKR